MSRSVWVNGHLVKQRMYQLGLSERDAGRRFGMTTSSLRSVTGSDALSTAFTIADVRRLIDTLGITWRDLLDGSSTPTDTGEATDDARTLIQLLSGLERAHDRDRLARALGWDLQRLNDAVDAAQSPLAALGLTVHRASNGLLLRSLDDLSPVRQRLDLLRDDEESVGQGTARVMHAAYQGTLSPQEDRNDHLVHLGKLHNLGILVDRRDKKGSRHSPAPDFTYCLDF